MSAKPVLPRELARRDVEAAVDHCVGEAGPEAALHFIAALQAVYRTISSHPGAGSPRYARELALPGLRSRGPRRFPYLAFYIERDDRIDVWRVLHAQRDVPAWMREADGGNARSTLGKR